MWIMDVVGDVGVDHGRGGRCRCGSWTWWEMSVWIMDVVGDVGVDAVRDVDVDVVGIGLRHSV